MNTALLFVAAACLADTIEPPLANFGPAAEAKKTAVGTPAPLPLPALQEVPAPNSASAPLVQPAPIPAPAANGDPGRLVPLPASAETQEPKPRRIRLFRRIFRRKSRGTDGTPANIGYYQGGEAVNSSPSFQTVPFTPVTPGQP